ncbi:MAG: hypothetical protein AAF560_12790, partial [Acidobacteriota bacterium]
PRGWPGPHREAPRVGAIGQQVGIAPAARRQDFVSTATAPPVAAATVDIAVSEWAPQICLVVDGDCQQSLALPVAEIQTGSFIPEVWVAGEDGAAVTLRWQIWDSEQGWRDAKASSVETTASGPRLDPEAAGSAPTSTAPLPFDDRAGQAMLHAERVVTRPGDGAEIIVRSNPLLVSLYEEGA